MDLHDTQSAGLSARCPHAENGIHISNLQRQDAQSFCGHVLRIHSWGLLASGVLRVPERLINMYSVPT